jgi:hypothetical protein
MPYLLILVSFAVGVLIGAKGYYLYANHMYKKYPLVFMWAIEGKVKATKNVAVLEEALERTQSFNAQLQMIMATNASKVSLVDESEKH